MLHDGIYARMLTVLDSEWGMTTRTTIRKSGKDPKGKKRKRQQNDDGDDGSDSDSTVAEPSFEQDETAGREPPPQDSTNLETVLLGRATVRAASVDADGEADAGAVTLQGSEEYVVR
jgi:hypothetical protein